MKRSALILSGVMVLGAIVSGASADDKKPSEGKPARPYPDLIGGLKKTPGCLGVETGRTNSGKQVIFAWFESKRAALKWYYSDVHQQAMNDLTPNYVPRKPLKEVPDDTGPILAIASLTLSSKPHFKEIEMPISQIAIELYRPVPGGVYLGGRFAPDSVKVPNMRDATPKKEAVGSKR
jgi:hypothetical protein